MISEHDRNRGRRFLTSFLLRALLWSSCRFLRGRFGRGLGGARGYATPFKCYVVDLHGPEWAIVARIRSHTGDLLHQSHCRGVALSKDCVPAVEVRCRHFGDKKLRAVGTGARIGHGQPTGTIERESRNDFVFERVPWIAAAV